MLSSQISISDKIVIDPNTKKGTVIIQNRGLTGCAYKMKTTNPKGYLVKPNSDIIPPLENATVTLTLHDKIEDEDKFMIEVYEIDWRDKNLDLKKVLGTEKAPIILSKRLTVTMKQQVEAQKQNIYSLVDALMFFAIGYKTIIIFKNLLFN